MKYVSTVLSIFLSTFCYANLNNLNFSLDLGREFAGADGQQEIIRPNNGSSTFKVHYSFSGESKYVGVKIIPINNVSGRFISLRLKGSLDKSISLRLKDSTNQYLQYSINRSNGVTDITGWTTVIVDTIFTSNSWKSTINKGSVNGFIKEIHFIINRNSFGDSSGDFYFSEIKILDDNKNLWRSSSRQSTLEYENIYFYNGNEFPGATGSVTVNPPFDSDSLQKVNYDFQNGGAYISSNLNLIRPFEGEFVEFRALIHSKIKLGLRVVDESNQTLQYSISEYMQEDQLGWKTIVVDLSQPILHWGGLNNNKVNGKIKKISIIINKSSGGPLQSIASFKNIKLINNPFYETNKLNNQSFDQSFSNIKLFKGLSIPPVGGISKTVLENGDIEQKIDYDFTNGGNYIGSEMSFTTPKEISHIKFLTKIPTGYDLFLRVKDSTNQEFQKRLFIPFNEIPNSNYVQVEQKIESFNQYWGGPNDGVLRQPIKTVSIFITIDRDKFHYGYVNKIGTYYIKRILFEKLFSDFDLSYLSPTKSEYRPLGTKPLETTGVIIHKDNLESFRIAKSMGFSYVRFDISWGRVEQSRGVYDFSEYDSKFEKLKNLNLKANIILDYNNTLYVENGKMGVTDTANILAFTEFAKQVARRYQVHSPIIEIWNEPDLDNFWQPSADPFEYASFYNYVYRELRRVGISSTILNGGLGSTNFEFLEVMNLNGSFNNGFGLAIHPYIKSSPERIGYQSAAMKNYLKTHRRNSNLWVTEVGASAAWFGSGTDLTAQKEQANLFIKQLLVNWSLDAKIVNLYQLSDEFDFVNPNNAEQNFGIFDLNFNDKVASISLRYLFNSIKNRTYQGLASHGTSNLQAMKFSQINNEILYVVWLTEKKSEDTFSFHHNCNPHQAFNGSLSEMANPCIVDMKGANITDCKSGANNRMFCKINEVNGPVLIRISR